MQKKQLIVYLSYKISVDIKYHCKFLVDVILLFPFLVLQLASIIAHVSGNLYLEGKDSYCTAVCRTVDVSLDIGWYDFQFSEMEV